MKDSTKDSAEGTFHEVRRLHHRPGGQAHRRCGVEADVSFEKISGKIIKESWRSNKSSKNRNPQPYRTCGSRSSSISHQASHKNGRKVMNL